MGQYTKGSKEYTITTQVHRDARTEPNSALRANFAANKKKYLPDS